MKFALYIAAHFLKFREEKAGRSTIVAIATVGIFFAVMAVMVALGVLKGYQKMYEDAVLNFSSHVIVFASDGLGNSDLADVTAYLNQQPQMLAFSPYQFHEALVPTKKGMTTVMFKGVETASLSQVYPIEFVNQSNAPCSVFVGTGLLEQLKNTATPVLNFISVRNPEGQARTKSMTLDYCGTFSSGYYDFDSRFVIMPLAGMYQKFSLSPQPSGVEIRLIDARKASEFKVALVAQFGERFDVLTWSELNSSLFEALKLDHTVVVSVSFLILLIACLNIFGFNYLFFISRKREFLILAALGCNKSTLTRVLMILSLMMGALATLGGCLAGAAVLYYLIHGPGLTLDEQVYYVNRVPAILDLPLILKFVVATCVLCLLTSLLAGRTVWHKFDTASLGHGMP